MGVTVESIGGYHASLLMRGVTVAGNRDFQIWMDNALPYYERVLVVGDVYCLNEAGWGSYSCCNLYGAMYGDCGGLGDQNLNLDPLFCDPETGHYSLSASSPCLPENNTWGVLIGARAQGCGPTSLSPETWARIKARYR
jgi:hypothetical protein